jgi:hypothetical protein
MRREAGARVHLQGNGRAQAVVDKVPCNLVRVRVRVRGNLVRVRVRVS